MIFNFKQLKDLSSVETEEFNHAFKMVQHTSVVTSVHGHSSSLQLQMTVETRPHREETKGKADPAAVLPSLDLSSLKMELSWCLISHILTFSLLQGKEGRTHLTGYSTRSKKPDSDAGAHGIMGTHTPLKEPSTLVDIYRIWNNICDQADDNVFREENAKPQCCRYHNETVAE